jgi:hypothetical protein
MPSVNRSIMATASEMSRSERLGSLKSKHGLTRCLRPHRLLQHMRRGEVHVNAKQIGKPVLKADHVQQCKAPRCVDVRDQIDVGRGRRVTASHGAVKAQMQNPGRFQFRFERTQRRNHVAKAGFDIAALRIAADLQTSFRRLARTRVIDPLTAALRAVPL